MKISIADGETIRNNILNTSVSKHGYSFSQDRRFRRPPANCLRAYYESGGRLSKRGTSFGYGERYDFTKTLTSSPAVTKYNPQIKMYRSLQKDKGKTFGICRELSPENGTMIKGIQNNPGVGAYDAKGQTASNIGYSMGARTLDVFHKHNSSRATPGPAAYRNRDQFPLDRFYSTKYQNPSLGRMNKTARFSQIKQSPGPQSYVAPDNLSSEGKYIVSKHCGQGTRGFSMTARTGFTQSFAKNKSQNPGPGKYEKHSEFGQYGDTTYYKTLTSFGKFKDISKANETY